MSRAARIRAREQVRALVTDSDLNRLTLRTNLTQLTPFVTGGGGGAFRLPGLVLPAVAAVAGAVFVRQNMGIGALYSGLTIAARWAVPLYRAWKKAGAAG